MTSSQTDVNSFLGSLSQIIKEVEEPRNNHEKARKLMDFVTTFVDRLAEENHETRDIFFHKLIAKVPEILVVLTNDDSLTEISARNHEENLQTAVLCLNALALSLHYSKTVEQLLSALQTAVTSLYLCYTHCKESEIIYGDLLEDFTDQLADFLIKVKEIQAAMVLEFDRLSTFDILDKDVVALVSVTFDLGKLCDVVSALDSGFGAQLWRKFIKIISKYSDHLRGNLKVDSFVSSIISFIINCIEEFNVMLTNKEEISDQEINIFVFQLNLVMKLSYNFPDSIEANIQHIRQLMLELFELLVMCYNPVSECDTERFKGLLTKTVPTMVSIFVPNKIYSSALSSYDVRLQTSQLLLHLSAVSYLISKNEVNLHNRLDMIKDIFELLQANKELDDLKFVSIEIPTLLLNDSHSCEQESDTLYEHTYLLLRQFSKGISDTDLEILENHVVSVLLSGSDLISLLVSDIWIYRLRCSSVDILFHRCIEFSRKASSNLRLKMISKRMLKFLPSDRVVQILSENEYFRSIVIEDVHLSNQLLCFIDGGIEQKISLLMTSVKNCRSHDILLLVNKACNILELLSLLLKTSNTCTLLKYIEVASILFKSDVFEIQLAVLKFLKCFEQKQLNERESDFDQIAVRLGSLLSLTMQSKNYIVRNEALKNFAELTKSIPHPKIFKQAIMMSPNLVPVIKLYLTEVPVTGFETEKDRLKAVERQLSSILNENNSNYSLSDTSREVLNLLLPT